MTNGCTFHRSISLMTMLFLKSDTSFYTFVYLVIIQEQTGTLDLGNYDDKKRLQFLFCAIIPTSKYPWQTATQVNFLHA